MSWESEINNAQAVLNAASTARSALNASSYQYTVMVERSRKKKYFFGIFRKTKYWEEPEIRFRTDDYNRDVASLDQNVNNARASFNAKVQEVQGIINNLVNEINVIDSDLSIISNIIHCDRNYDQNFALINSAHIGIKCDAHISKKNSAANKLNFVIANLTNIQRSELFIEFSKNQVKQELFMKILASGDLDLSHIVNYAIDNNDENFFNIAINKGFDFANNGVSKEKLLRFLIEKKSVFIKNFLENLTDFECVKDFALSIINVQKELLEITNKSSQTLFGFIIKNCSDEVAKKALDLVNVRDELRKIVNQTNEKCEESLFMKIIDLDSKSVNLSLLYYVFQSENSHLSKYLLEKLSMSGLSFKEIEENMSDIFHGSLGKRNFKEFEKMLEDFFDERGEDCENFDLLIGKIADNDFDCDNHGR